MKTCPELRLWFAGMSSAEEPSSLHPSAACGFANEASRGPGSLPAKESGDSRLWGLVQAPAVPSPGRPRPGEASAPRPLGENPKGRRGAGRPSPYCGHCACTQLLSRVQLLAAPWTVAFQVLCPRDSPNKNAEVVAISSSRGSYGGAHLTPDHQGCRLTAESSPQCPSKRLNRPEAEGRRRRGSASPQGLARGVTGTPLLIEPVTSWPLRLGMLLTMGDVKGQGPGGTSGQKSP